MWRENLQMLVLLRTSHLFLFHTHLWLPNGCEPLQPDIKVANFFDAMLLDLDGSWIKQCKLQTLLLWHWEGLQNRDKPTDQWTSQPTLNCKRCSWIWTKLFLEFSDCWAWQQPEGFPIFLETKTSMLLSTVPTSATVGQQPLVSEVVFLSNF